MGEFFGSRKSLVSNLLQNRPPSLELVFSVSLPSDLDTDH
jgi:hypothetical protein